MCGQCVPFVLIYDKSVLVIGIFYADENIMVLDGEKQVKSNSTHDDDGIPAIIMFNPSSPSDPARRHFGPD